MEQGLEWRHFGSQARKERRLSYTCAGLSHLWDIHLKPRHVLGEIMLPLTVARLNSSCTSLSLLLFISFSIALSHSPLPPSISLESSCYKLTCGDNGWTIFAKRMVQVIPEPFLPIILGPIKYKICGPERLPVLCGDTRTRSSFHPMPLEKI